MLTSTEANDNYTDKADEKQNKIPSQYKTDSKRVSNNPIHTVLIKKEQSADTRSPTNIVIPEIMSTTNGVIPINIHSKEEFTPVGTKYRSKTKPVDRLTSFLKTLSFLDLHHLTTRNL